MLSTGNRIYLTNNEISWIALLCDAPEAIVRAHGTGEKLSNLLSRDDTGLCAEVKLLRHIYLQDYRLRLQQTLAASSC